VVDSPSLSANSTPGPPDEIEIESDWRSVLAVGVSESVTLTVKLKTPVAVGVPLMTPVPEAIERPVGSEPESIDQVAARYR
jgi:hypothetical protein